ncbi:uncharacterized protein BO88DRAFT_425401 [Aspergillus vadensis CBS 113365]|uniref:Uncharacterized protein n=1 Tax=Aspergillus vadensis (strain CBS 113365 / IMI 142717 / IBT 24658) TaxID=1448311 RepID=A0A319BAL6_ASPVC|nr:hypothetical protein BO88DRAFT_425401 [Aspergillus vadensis CBS 113365]PYH69737.1 hypothetical protein BO88DRAFT_425401 [Aspergillus vadensis CBS 113365]
MMLPITSQLYQVHQIAAGEHDVLALGLDSHVSGSAIRTETTDPLSLFNLIWCQSITLAFLPLPAHPSGSWVPGGPASVFSEEISSLAIILVGCQRFPLNWSFNPEFQLNNIFVLPWRLA